MFTDKCVFCGNKSSVGYKGQGICEGCFSDIFDWSYSQAVSKKLASIHKDISALIRREMALNPQVGENNVIKTEED